MKKLFLILSITSFLFLGILTLTTTYAEEAAAPVEQVKPSANTVVVYYFYTNARCPTCHKLEKYTEESVTTSFADLIKKGVVQFKAINTDEKANEHFLKDYQLFTKSVIVSQLHDGNQVRWKNLSKIWELVGDKDSYIKYVKDEIQGYIEEM